MIYQYKVTHPSSTGEIRRRAAVIAGDLKFDETQIGKISIVINELSTNILKHAGSGEIILISKGFCLEVLALDKGPGMKNLNECLRDGYSTQGTQGTGLGAIKRLSTNFELFTKEDMGTVVYCSFSHDHCPEDKYTIDYGAVLVPYPGEEVCGDGWSLLEQGPGQYKVLVSDGLGHGLLANEASRTAIEAFGSYANQTPLQDINALHLALRSTRGAAVAIAEINLQKDKVNYAGLGNISATIASPQSVKKLISYNGTVGVQLRKVQPMSYAFEKDAVLIMHSDGLGTHWSISDYPGLILKHPTLIAAVLYRDFNRGTDDVSVIVIRKK